MASLGTNCLKYAVFAGSSKDAKLDEKVMKYVVRVIRDTRHETVIFGPDSMDIPFVKKPVHYYSDRSQAPEWLRDAEKKLETCDGFIYLCPEVNRSIPANLSNMIDHFGSNVYQAKPAAIITYSDTDIVDLRTRTHLHDLLSSMGAIVVENMHLPLISRSHTKLDSEGQLTDEGMSSQIDKKITTYLSQMDWYAIAIKNHKELYEPIPI
ncbi:2-hydroxy-1,4-benzoquinone reductase-like isoform X2 [Convolutriloba macropyga]|uniref:2-hydroxy-1,4-benzoquinone reductase-like isoform X2 n=1 Tax=Convolutriloba macropyga TaxID=536237 RepID=UPI003F5240ED